jgi:hypothetical protein
MAKFLLWNVQKKPLDGLVVRLADEHRVRVVILVERPADDSTPVRALQGAGSFVRIPSWDRFGVYTRFPPRDAGEAVP